MHHNPEYDKWLNFHFGQMRVIQEAIRGTKPVDPDKSIREAELSEKLGVDIKIK